MPAAGVSGRAISSPSTGVMQLALLFCGPTWLWLILLWADRIEPLLRADLIIPVVVVADPALRPCADADAAPLGAWYCSPSSSFVFRKRFSWVRTCNKIKIERVAAKWWRTDRLKRRVTT